MSLRQFVDDAVQAHNDYRERHSVAPLRQSSELNGFAQKWAEHLVSTNTFQHCPSRLNGEKLGENIAMNMSNHPERYTGRDAVEQWYSEEPKHRYGTEPTTLGSGHFSQVVWKGSTEVGIGKAQAQDGKIIVVGNYRPAGNMVGRFSENVLPPKGNKHYEPKDRTAENPSASDGRARFSRDADFGRDFGRDSFPSGGGGRSESKSVRTFTTREGSGPNAVTKTIVEETITLANGQKQTTRTETVTSGNDSSDNDSKLSRDMGRMNIGREREPFSSRSFGRESSDSNTPQKLDDFLAECVKGHNNYRAKHGVPPVKHAPDLSAFAQKWADHLASTNSFQHSSCILGGDHLGENIASKQSSGAADYTGTEVVDQWYSEVSKYPFGTPSGASGAGHFSQVVWKGSNEVGFGKAHASGNRCIVVASYRPAGNVVGQYRENVFRAK